MLKTAVKHRWMLLPFIAAVVAALWILTASGYVSDVRTAIDVRLGQGEEYHSGPDYFGPWSLEERIAFSDVVARVRMRSVIQTEEARIGDGGTTEYLVALEFTFDALEYLKGSGGDQLKAVVYDFDVRYATKLGASTLGQDLLSLRDKRWEGREAIVFLQKRDDLPSTKQADRYLLGWLSTDGTDEYTIDNRSYQSWLPDAASPVAASVQSGEQRFLLEVPLAEGAQGSSGHGEQTITLSALKTRIAGIGRGGRSRRNLYGVHRRRISRMHLSQVQEQEKGQLYHRPYMVDYYPYGITDNRFDISVNSGLPAGTHVYWEPIAREWLAAHGEQKPSTYRR